MNDLKFAGALLRMLRLERNWSQETLCQGICAVSYLSKIEQGKVQPNEALLKDLFARLDTPWDSLPEGEGRAVCELLYELVFADDTTELHNSREYGLLRQEGLAMGAYYLDYLVLRAYCCRDKSLLRETMLPLLNSRQMCLIYLLEEEPEKAMQIYPCALTAKNAGIRAYQKGNYAEALAHLQHGYDMAAENGYARIMLFCRSFMANCYSDMRKIDLMHQHYTAAKRLARALGEVEILRAIEYNEASTAVECGEYEVGYAYFSKLEKLSVLDAHKLAICCEKMERPVEAITMLNVVRDEAEGIEKKMCDLVRFRLKNREYLRDPDYGKLLMDTFSEIKTTLPVGFARFHLPWVEEWCTANRQYRTAYELMKEFS